VPTQNSRLQVTEICVKLSNNKNPNEENSLQKERVEHQKFLRTKLEDNRYQDRFGLSDNIELEAEDVIPTVASQIRPLATGSCRSDSENRIRG
jgi:nucleosome binding factor SPN SPT16 subunit